MKTFVTLVIAAAFSGLANAVPHGMSHQKFHVPNARNAVKPHHRHHHHTKDAATTSALVQSAQPANVDWVHGTCGGSTGFVCGTGYCCSQYGYCGQGNSYCGSNESTNQTASSASAIATTAAATAAPSTLATVATSAVSPIATAASSTWGPVPTSAVSPAASSAPQASGTSPSPSTSLTSSAIPATSSPAGGSSGGAGFGDVFKMYNGDGSTAAGWPSDSDWESFDAMWAANQGNIGQSCSQFGVPNNSDDETADVKSAIQSVGSSAGVDPRFILAIILQESAGCVRAPTTNYGVTNPGLMQSHDGAGSCNNGGNVQTPCPMSEITQMIEDGVEGTSSGDGLKQCLASAPNASGAQQYYEAARIYNSGSIAAGGNLDAGIATQCYSVDIANRLTGWVDAPTTCDLSS